MSVNYLTLISLKEMLNSEFVSGGGFTLSTAAGVKYSNLNAKIGTALSGLGSLNNNVIVLILIALTVFLTNFASNVAVCNVITPIAMQLVSGKYIHIVAPITYKYCISVCMLRVLTLYTKAPLSK